MGQPPRQQHVPRNARLNCLLTNACSIINKLDELALIIVDKSPDIIAITESWLDPSIPDAELSFPGYSLFRCDRTSGKGGGCLLYLKASLNPAPISDIIPKHPNGFEVCGCKIHTPEGPLHVLNVYRTPSSSIPADDDILRLFTTINNQQGDCLIIGDFNAPQVDWENMFCPTDGSFSDRLLDKCLQHLFTQGILIPTRFRIGNRPSNIDLAFTKLPQSICNVSSSSPLGKSDHSLVWFDFDNVSVFDESPPEERYQFHKLDTRALIAAARNYDWTSLNHLHTVNDLWHGIKGAILHLTEAVVPKAVPRFQRNNNPPWFTHGHRRLLALKHQAYLLWQEDGTEESFNNFKQLRNRANSSLRKAKMNFEQKLAKRAAINNKEFFAFIRQKRELRTDITSLKSDDGTLINQPDEQADIFKDYFSTVFRPDQHFPAPPLSSSPPPSQMRPLIISSEQVERELRRLDVNKGAYPDGIHT